MNFKKTLLTLVGVLCSLGMWAATDNIVTFGLCQSINENEKSLGSAQFFSNDEHVTNKGNISGSNVDNYMGTGSTRSVYVNGTAYTTQAQWRKKVNTTTYDANQWCGYNLEIESGYKLNITGVHAMLAVADDTYTWKVVIQKESGEVIYESQNKTTKKASTTDFDLNFASLSDEVKAKMTGIVGKISVRVYMYQGGSTKYFAIPYLAISGTVSQDTAPKFTLTTEISNSDAGTFEGAGQYSQGTVIVPTVNANPGWAVYQFTVRDVDAPNQGQFVLQPGESLTMNKNYDIYAIMRKLPLISYRKNSDDIKGTLPADFYGNVKYEFTPTYPFFCYKEGSTFVGYKTQYGDQLPIWLPNTKHSSQSNIYLYPVYEKNTFALGDQEVNVTWNFNKSTGAPEINCENKEIDYVGSTGESGAINTIDLVMHVNTNKGAYADGVTGKLNNVSQTVCAQVNAGTIFTIPAMKGMTITYTCTNGTPNVGSVLFDGKEGTLEGKVFTYTYNGNASTITIVATESNYYPNGISAKYPKIEKPVLGPDFLPVDPQGNGEAIYTDGYLPVDPSTLGHTNGMITFPEETPEQEGANSGDAATGINNAQTAGAQVVGVYGANGAKAAQLQKGLNIIKLANGKTVKVVK